ncbi:hypothetical protein [Burkholderia sp. Ac-20353]|uniref:hypothetical protein n=1 Tax=Burkholderia sp. Ac-20353 TaxID=2703894 RepID=UPI00197C93E8|nr:hypothetical protein [Burkholderia sp. Ac-20353]MBN3785679.1 hypothetical protein [Burkholderia sp. Ac-20353]
MQGKALFLDRAVARTRDWGPHFPALSIACREPGSISCGRQVVVAAADDHGVRCAFFTNFGSLFDFACTWAELERARSWWHFVREWHFWIVDSDDSLRRLFAGKGIPDGKGLVVPTTVAHRQDDAFLRFIERVESVARTRIGIVEPA